MPTFEYFQALPSLGDNITTANFYYKHHYNYVNRTNNKATYYILFRKQ